MKGPNYSVSFFGAIASFFILRIFNLVLFETYNFLANEQIFIVASHANKSPLIPIIWITLFLLGFLRTQNKVSRIITGKIFHSNLVFYKFFSSKKEIFKALLALFFLGTYLFFLFVYYPFPKIESSRIAYIIFELITILVTLPIFNKIYSESSGIQKPTNWGWKESIPLFAFSFVFLFFGLMIKEAFYIFGFFGIGLIIHRTILLLVYR